MSVVINVHIHAESKRNTNLPSILNGKISLTNMKKSQEFTIVNTIFYMKLKMLI